MAASPAASCTRWCRSGRWGRSSTRPARPSPRFDSCRARISAPAPRRSTRRGSFGQKQTSPGERLRAHQGFTTVIEKRYQFQTAMRILLAVLVLTSITPARANERHFAFTYESPTLPAGAVELEPWTTWRVGRDRYYSRFDHR